MNLLLLLILIAVGGLPLLIWFSAVMLLAPLAGFILFTLPWYVLLLYGPGPFAFTLFISICLLIAALNWRSFIAD
jgi:hypothetical protein